MKLTDIIRKGNEIQDRKSCFFIAEIDFSYNNLSILKNSLIFYDGKSLIKVNIMEFGIFQESNIPELISNKLPKENHRNYMVEKCSNCVFEVEELESGWRGIWHDNHFDKWSGSYSDYIERIKNLPSLQYSGITFSPLMYKFNTLTNSLVHFINVKPITIELHDKVIELPELLEISIDSAHYTIIPLSGIMKYFDIQLQGCLFLHENGILTGECAEEFDAEIYGHNEIKKITISKGFDVEISSTGSIQIGLFDNTSHKMQKYQIRKSK